MIQDNGYIYENSIEPLGINYNNLVNPTSGLSIGGAYAGEQSINPHNESMLGISMNNDAKFTRSRKMLYQ